jgi:4-hydroxy-4-methyl-2-oxoglutarate aldolase
MPSLIVEQFQRPAPDIIAALRELPTTALSDAMGRRGAMDAAIQPILPSMRTVGPAFTLKPYTADNLTVHLALKFARPGDVLVLDSSGYANAAHWGELTSRAALIKGLAGLVTDGPVRDREANVELGFPVFSKGFVPTGTVKATLGLLNRPVVCGGQTVLPGDLIVGDADGVVVVPRDQVESVIEGARKQLARESEMRERVLQGETLFDILGLQAAMQRLGLDALEKP